MYRYVYTYIYKCINLYMKTIEDKYYISNYIYILVEIIHTEFQ